MTNSPRKASSGLVGIKVLIIVMSLVGTICGWTLLAANQVRETLMTQTAPRSQSVQTAPQAQPTQIAPNNSQQNQPPALRQVPGSSRPNARTRSSR